MGNKRNHTPRRKKRPCYFKRHLNLKKNESSTVNNANDGDIINVPVTVVDKISVLPISHGQYERSDLLVPITPNAGDREQNVQDPLFSVKSEVKEEESSSIPLNEFPNVVSVKAEPEIEPTSNENVKENDKENSIACTRMCRLCLTTEGGNWIEIFSNEPYRYGCEITPSNILEIIERCTTVKITKNDQLSHKLCGKCLQSLRFVNKFREKSLHSQKSLNFDVNEFNKSLNGQNQQNKLLLNGIQLQPIKRIVKVIHLESAPKPVVSQAKLLTLNEMDKRNKDFGEVQCEFCGMVFDKYKPLQYHLNKHTGVRPFACTELFCDKSFFSPQNRKTHILNMHSTQPKFECDICEKTYNKAEKLNIHRTVHFPPTLPCAICGKLLRNQETVRKHRASHAERMHKCEDCGKSFQNAYTLRVHRRIHTNEKPFVCCVCGEAFAHKCSLKTHTEKKHEGEN